MFIKGHEHHNKRKTDKVYNQRLRILKKKKKSIQNLTLASRSNSRFMAVWGGGRDILNYTAEMQSTNPEIWKLYKTNASSTNK